MWSYNTPFVQILISMDIAIAIVKKPVANKKSPLAAGCTLCRHQVEKQSTAREI